MNIEAIEIDRSIEVLQDGHPLLRRTSEPVEDFNAELRLLAAQMERIVSIRRALGLAAIQIGTPRRVIVVKLQRGMVTMVNPVITRRLNRFAAEREGCLSVPRSKWRQVLRPAKCEVTWQDLAGSQHSDGFSGLDARIIQHECDHLDGVLITDHPPVMPVPR